MRLLFIYLFSFFIVTLFSSPQSFGSEDSTYNFSWLDPDKEVYVLQNRKFRKSGRLAVHVGYGFTSSGAFVDSSSAQARATFYIKEEWGIEGIYAQNSGKENTAAQSVRNPGGAGSVPFRRIVENYYGGLIVWSPFYAKINTFNKIIYLDWIIGVGYGKVTEKNNRQDFEAGGTNVNAIEASETHNAIMWETGLKFWVSESFDVRMDLTALHFKAQKAVSSSTEEVMNSNYDLTLSLGYNF